MENGCVIASFVNLVKASWQEGGISVKETTFMKQCIYRYKESIDPTWSLNMSLATKHIQHVGYIRKLRLKLTVLQL